MAESKIRKILSSRASIFLLLLAFIWISLVLVKAMYRKYQLDQEIASLKSEIDKTEKKGQELSQFLEYFSSQSFLEKEAKDKLNLKKEGENVVMIPEAAIGEQLTAEEALGVEKSKNSPAEENNFIKWWKFFFKR